MLLMITMILALTTASRDIIATAMENFDNISSYQVTLRSTGGANSEEIKYYYKKPGFVRMEFIKPYGGAVLVYDPFKKRVRLRPFAFLKFFILTLSPQNRLLRSAKGHRVDASDIGTLLKRVMILQSNGIDKNLSDQFLGGKHTTRISIEGKDNFTVGGIHTYIIWIDKITSMPLKASAYNTRGELIESVLMDDLQINIKFSENFFDLE